MENYYFGIHSDTLNTKNLILNKYDFKVCRLQHHIAHFPVASTFPYYKGVHEVSQAFIILLISS